MKTTWTTDREGAEHATNQGVALLVVPIWQLHPSDPGFYVEARTRHGAIHAYAHGPRRAKHLALQLAFRLRRNTP